MQNTEITALGYTTAVRRFINLIKPVRQVTNQFKYK